MKRMFELKSTRCLIICILFCFSSLAHANHHPSSPEKNGKSQHIKNEKGNSISSNPAAVNARAGSGDAQKFIEQKLGITNNHGIYIDGAWIADINDLFSGGIPHADRWTNNSLFILGLTIDTNQLMCWRGGLFGAQLLQFNGQSTNAEAGTVQGYNSLPGPRPLNRTELYQLWFRQDLYNEKVFIRIGKVVPTFDFNNVIRPVPIGQSRVMIPAVTGLIYTPIFVNTSMLGVLPGYYNSAYGITLNLLPTANWYISFGTYDGNLAQGIQTGLTGPNINGNYFDIAETGITWLLGKYQLPGIFAFGAWHQTGLIVGSPILSERGASGYYLFGSQRLWYRDPGIDNSGVSAFFQYGGNNSSVLPMLQYAGGGLTAFGLIPCRPDDSVGIGAAFSWLNQKSFHQKTELIIQSYYQAQIIKDIFFEPVLSYIPRPATTPNHHSSWAATARIIVLF